GLFAAFFPSQIAGPIKRYQDFIAQLGKLKSFREVRMMDGLGLIMQGLFKKVAIADNLAPAVAYGFEHASSLGTIDAWVSVVAFTIQIYCDFSGYTDIGLGSAAMLG